MLEMSNIEKHGARLPPRVFTEAREGRYAPAYLRKVVDVVLFSPDFPSLLPSLLVFNLPSFQLMFSIPRTQVSLP